MAPTFEPKLNASALTHLPIWLLYVFFFMVMSMTYSNWANKKLKRYLRTTKPATDTDGKVHPPPKVKHEHTLWGILKNNYPMFSTIVFSVGGLLTATSVGVALWLVAEMSGDFARDGSSVVMEHAHDYYYTLFAFMLIYPIAFAVWPYAFYTSRRQSTQFFALLLGIFFVLWTATTVAMSSVVLQRVNGAAIPPGETDAEEYNRTFYRSSIITVLILNVFQCAWSFVCLVAIGIGYAHSRVIRVNILNDRSNRYSPMAHVGSSIL